MGNTSIQAKEASYDRDDVISRLGFRSEINALRDQIEDWISVASEEMNAELRWQLIAP